MVWKMMSSEHHENKTYDKLMIDTYFKGDWDQAHYVKSFTHQSLIDKWLNPHFAEFHHDVDGIDNRVISTWQFPFFQEEDFFFNTNSNRVEKKLNWLPSADDFQDAEHTKPCIKPTTDWFIKHYYLKSWEEYVFFRVKPKYNAAAIVTLYHTSENTREVWLNLGHAESPCHTNDQFTLMMNHTLHSILHQHVETLSQGGRLHQFVDRMHHLYCNSTTTTKHNAVITKDHFIRGSRFFVFHC